MPGSKVGPGARVMGPTTSRIRRHDVTYDNDRSFVPTALTPAPPLPPAKPPRPLGDLDEAPAEEIAALTAATFGGGAQTAANNRYGMGWLLEHLEKSPGATWQQRWDAAGLNEPGVTVAGVADPRASYSRLIHAAAGQAFAMRLIQPSLRTFRSYRFWRYPVWFRQVAADPLLDDFFDRVEALPVSPRRQHSAYFDVCCVLTVFGIDLADLTPEALLHYAVESRKYGLTGTERPGDGCFAATQAWPVLYEMGHFPAAAPRTLRAAVTKGQRPIAELVDRHHLRNRAVRNLLIDYVTRRSAGLDYSTTTSLVNLLVRTFWKQIEEINPSQVDLRLSEDVITRWKEWLLVLPSGKPRIDVDGPLMAVRALYLDLQSWAAAEPERWAAWAAPCPIRDADLRWFHVRRRRLQERMANRTRDRQPLLPVLSRHVSDRWQNLHKLLQAARDTELGARFTVEGTTYQRVANTRDKTWRDPAKAPIRVINRDTGELLGLSRAESQAFWQWAVIETLRLAGLRVEELTELTHLSVRNYRRPNGEVVALLVVSPSKSDRERVIPMSAELFHVIAQLVRRHIGRHGTVPVASRYDVHEKVWSPPLPYLFQTSHSAGRRGMSTATVWRMIHRATAELALTHPEFAQVKFAPHDFRRLFATELVNNGLPIHIGAALLGHLNIQTTRGYVAVFNEDVVAHYQQFLDCRRAQRPQDEYRTPTNEEWGDFQEHFDKRRVELGSCGRPYGTGCAHEHACVRCPMLSIDPKMLSRLEELEEDLLARRTRATTEGWKGEVDGIDLTLTYLRGKKEQARRAATIGPTSLGMPAPSARR